MTTRPISINRAPVVTLWAAVLARRMGFNKKPKKGDAMRRPPEQC